MYFNKYNLNKNNNLKKNMKNYIYANNNNKREIII